VDMEILHASRCEMLFSSGVIAVAFAPDLSNDRQQICGGAYLKGFLYNFAHPLTFKLYVTMTNMT
jgi:hypothetical protein